MTTNISRHFPQAFTPGLRSLGGWITASAFALLMLAGCDRSPKSAQQSGGVPPAPSSASITATPNPVPAGPGNGTTTVSWDTGDGSPGEVYVSVDGGEENIFSKRTQGSEPANWIKGGSTYVFRLYAGTDRSKLLSEVKVTRSEK